MFAAIIIVLMLVSSTAMIGTFSDPFLNISEKEQLKVAAQKLMTQLLLNTGDPPEWGSTVNIHASDLETFGLAKHGETTREAYVLDPDKVLRLTLQDDDPLYIPPSQAVQLLNLGNDYGFAIEFYPALTVNINKASYVVSVTSEKDGLPIWYARVYAKMYYYDNGQIKSTPQINAITETDGKCIFNFGITAEQKILVLAVEYYGIHVTKIVNLSDTDSNKAYLIGNQLYSATNYNNPVEIMVNKKEGSYVIESVAYLPGKNIEPTTIAVLAVSNSDLLCAYRLPEEEQFIYSSIKGMQSFPFAYSVERSVIILDSAYIVRLYLWRMSF